MRNVKHYTHNGEHIETSCKRKSTALHRFVAFLSEYDSYFTDMVNELFETGNNVVTHKAHDYTVTTMLLEVENDTYHITIKVSIEPPETLYCICTQNGTIKEFETRKECFEYAYKNDLAGDFDDIWIEEKELKDPQFREYETVDYESCDLYSIRTMLELDICDDTTNTTADTTDTTKDTIDTTKDTIDTTKDTIDTTKDTKKRINKKYGLFSHFRIYGTPRKIGDNYYEVPYREFNVIGSITSGTEDFTKERLQSCTKVYVVRSFNGKVSHGAYRDGMKYTDENYMMIRVSINTPYGIVKFIADSEFPSFARCERVHVNSPDFIKRKSIMINYNVYNCNMYIYHKRE